MEPHPEPVCLLPAAARLCAKGRTWFFADDLEGPVPHAALVRVIDGNGRDLGVGSTSSRSRIALRLCGRSAGEGPPDPRAFLERRIRSSVARRGPLDADQGVRLVHGDADGVPGLVVDRYGPCLVLQVTSPLVEKYLDAVVPALLDCTGAESVLARNDVAARELEGLPEEVRLLHGRSLESVAIEEHGVRYTVRPFTGQKTGFYLDQGPARRLVMDRARGRRVLDLFAYQGAFSLAALTGGAASALAVDQSQPALDLALEDARRAGLQGLRTERANAFEMLRALRENGETFDLIVLDPPAFAKSRRERRGGLQGYRDLNRLALRVLAPGGLLLTCSCSHHVSLPMFEDVLRQASAGLPFRVLLRQRLGAGDDHPVWLALPESEYLKVVLLERADQEDPT